MRRIALLALASVSIGLVACGHPATREECETILNKSAELKLKEDQITDPKIVAEKLAGLKEAKGDELLKACTGKTITKGALDCVKLAETSEAVDACLY